MSKVVVITGCGSGIGKTLALEFNKKKKYVVYATSRRLSSMDDLKAIGINTLQIDVSNTKEIQDGISKILKKEKKIDILVNNAGYTQYGPLLELSVEDFKKNMDVNFHGVIRMIKEVTPHMIEKKSGMLVTISSISGLFGSPYSSAYVATKFALNGLMDSIRHELYSFGIKCVNVQPGAIETELFNNGWERVKNMKYKYYEKYKACVKTRVFKASVGTKAKDFSKELVKRLEKSNIPNVIKIGKKTWLYPFLNDNFKFLYDFIMRELLGLHKVNGRAISIPRSFIIKFLLCIFILIILWKIHF